LVRSSVSRVWRQGISRTDGALPGRSGRTPRALPRWREAAWGVGGHLEAGSVRGEGLRPVATGEGDRRDEATVVPRHEGERARVDAGDARDQGEAEPVPPRSVGPADAAGTAQEGLAEPSSVVWRVVRTGVLDAQHHGSAVIVAA